MIISSCSFRSDEQVPEETKNQVTNHEELKPTPNSDSDGDGMKDQEELNQGRNPFLADLPILDIKFLQNFKITGIYDGKEKGQFTIDTKVGESDPDFKYRVGHIFARHNTYKNAASIGVFSTHNYGEIAKHDLSWVKYPDIDPIFFHNESLKNRKYLDEKNYQLNSLSIDLENSVKLKANGLYKSIKNLKVKFYYFDYEKDSYELLQEVLVERHFNTGIRETFSVKLDNIPVNLLKDNFFKKGQFIISELSDYEIPELETTYKQLLAQVEQKSVPFVFNTPRETSVYYVGTNGQGISFQNILTAVFDKQFEIKENELTKVEQFENNLEDYTYLNEIKKLDKKGKWFLLTSHLNQHYLDYKFTPKDHIVLSYITGSELASQGNETVFSFRENVSGGDDYKEYPLGNVTPNTEIDIHIRPEKSWGISPKHFTEVIDDRGGSCGKNCIRTPIYCKWEINKMEHYDRPLVLSKGFTGETSRIELVINNEAYNLSELANKKLLNTYWKDGNLHIQILDISKIKDIVSYEENLVSLRIKTQKKFDYWGVKLVGADRVGSHGMGGCAFNTPAVAFKFGARNISRESIRWDEIQITYDRVLNDAGRANLTLKPADNYYQRISVSVSSTIKNNFN